jgi:paraquat-inducible protein A
MTANRDDSQAAEFPAQDDPAQLLADLHFVTARQLGMIACRHCGTVWRDVSDGERCGRCRARLYSRKPESINLTWALLLTACILYLPANLLPVMTTRSLLGTQEDTILSGVIYFWISGDWALAVIIFIASFLVPLFKLTALVLMAVTARRHSVWARAERTRLYHIVEVIGRWSMLDVFVVSLLAGLVKMDQVAEITAGPGIASFGGVVVLTMLASISFDPRLAWDPAASAGSQAAAADLAVPVTGASNG